VIDDGRGMPVDIHEEEGVPVHRLSWAYYLGGLALFFFLVQVATGLLPYFDVVVSGDVLPRPKPDPMPLLWACGRLAVSPIDALMIGDSVHDFHAGRAACCHVFLVPYGYNEGRDVRELACDGIVLTLAEAATRLTHA